MSLARLAPLLVAARPLVLARLAPIVAARCAAPLLMQQQRGMADKITEKESQQEKDFVNRQERLALKLQLLKLEQEADPGQKKALAALEAKLAANKISVSDKLKKDLLDWKAQAH